MPESFRNLDIWKDANYLAIELYKIIGDFPDFEKFSLANQINRAAVSVPANIAESCGRYGIKDKIQLLMVSRGSLYEIRSHLSIALGLKYIDMEKFQDLENRYEILAKRLNAFIKHLKST